MPSGFFYLNSLDQSISSKTGGGVGEGAGVWLVLLFPSFEIVVLTANSVDTDRAPRFVASDLGLHVLTMSFLWDGRHKWVNTSDIFKHGLTTSLSE